jgi:phthiocerol/phenolphthiocerol synthesis type-I polyketide synthase C
LEVFGRYVNETAVIGRACRLPGAPSTAALWDLLRAGKCAVTKIPEDRWNLSRFGHPRSGEPGFSYTWAAGVLDDIWGFDAAAFGISPREAVQMDPQQRLLLELVREALDDAGVPAASLAGTDVGVFVGASALDHGNSKLFDIAASDAYFASGNTLSLISNRISYIYDLRGPSLTIDTACSSSLVALHQAVSAIKSGQIKTAIVAGVNILASPFSFIGFSRASMLSPTGLCHAFDEKADGYVRAEGGVVLVLRALPEALAARNELHGLIVATGSNSDGRTVGIAMPSAAAQANLLARVYRENHLDPQDLAFVEAHGTGTRVGDPAEARAIGESLGRKRSRPLPIGSIKTNIGHLEPASGLAGVLKSMLALEHNVLPASLHCDRPNRDIPFDDFNISVCTQPTDLTNDRDRLAGVSSFGFGGTNAHAVIGRPPVYLPETSGSIEERNRIVLLSAHSDKAVSTLADSYAERIAAADEAQTQRIVAAMAHRRDRGPVRLAILSSCRADLEAALRDIGSGQAGDNPLIVRGKAIEAGAATAFVFSGNGSQWSGMGRQAFAANERFREAFRQIDERFASLAGWRLEDTLFADDLAQQLALTSIAQPLIFALQYATTQTLACLGLRPDIVLGHSVGEIAAAQASGILSLEAAIAVVHARSTHQERARLRGRMMVVFAGEEMTLKLLARHPTIELAALNSPGAFTVSGPEVALTALKADAQASGIKAHLLDLDYPFHCSAMDVVRDPLLADLATLQLNEEESIRFVSTVDPASLATPKLDGEYWWRNVRKPVLFSDGVRCAAALGARIFIEIGPRPTLLRHIVDSIAPSGTRIDCLGSLDKSQDGDPFPRMLASALVRGAKITAKNVAGADPGPGIALPPYPWQRKIYRLGDTSEALSVLNPAVCHPLIGARLSPDATEWRHHIDTARLPDLADHEVDGTVLLPGAAFVEMMWAAAREWLGLDTAAIIDLDLLQPMVLANGVAREVKTTISPCSGVIEISSRQRLSAVAWSLHAKAKIMHPTGPGSAIQPGRRHGAKIFKADVIYAKAKDAGLTFGPAFQQVAQVLKYSEKRISVDLKPLTDPNKYGVAPSHLDSCFHGLIILFGDEGIDGGNAYVPIKFGDCRLERPGHTPVSSEILVKTFEQRKIVADFTLRDASGAIVAVLRDARFQAKPSDTRRDIDNSWVQTLLPLPPLTPTSPPFESVSVADVLSGISIIAAESTAVVPPLSPDSALLEGWATVFAYDLAFCLNGGPHIDVPALVQKGRLAEGAAAWFSNLMYTLTSSGLARDNGGIFDLVSESDLPPPMAVLGAIAREFPQNTAELLTASQLAQCATTMLTPERRLFENSPISPSTLESLRYYSASTRRTASAMEAMLRSTLHRVPPGIGLRILQLGYGPIFSVVCDLADTFNASLTLMESDTKCLEKARLSRRGSAAGLNFASSWAELEGSQFDLVVSAGRLHYLPELRHSLQPLKDLLAPGGLFLAAEPLPSLFADLAGGLGTEWFLNGASTNAPVGLLKDAQGWARSLAIFAEHGIRYAAVEDDRVQVMVGRSDNESIRPAPAGQSVAIISHGDLCSDLVRHLESDLTSHGHTVSTGLLSKVVCSKAYDHLIYLDRTQSSSPVDQLTQRILRLKDLVEKCVNVRGTVCVVTYGAFSHDDSEEVVTEAGVWAFLRTVANEYPGLALRQIDMSPRDTAETCAGLISGMLSAETAETELVLDAHRTRAVRIAPAPVQTQDDKTRTSAQLMRARGAGGLDRLAWINASRCEPGPLDVEIEVKATGLNFRDLMSAMSLLPDSILEHGFAGPTLGLECSGVVMRIGSKVRGFLLGDRVIALTRNGFATHVIVPAIGVRKIPKEMPFEAAASIPVAFSTAYYSLVTLAKIRRGESVLIHGGAGGVGLAALQVAKWRGAKVIASAGSKAKRDLLLCLGADHVVDSRSLSFADDVRSYTPDGVHVVLNSVTGEAMERSIMLLRPFGRFIELGKRDYVANTHVGLAPFKRNLSYHGVDLDQLVIQRPKLFAQLLDAVVSGLAAGNLTPISYRVFPAAGVGEAFRVMQQSTHVGKLILTPPEITERTHVAPPKPFEIDGSHLITGGLGGFGLKTALWLARQGVRHLILVGRNAPREIARKTLDQLSEMGVAVQVAACDVADETALAVLLADIRKNMPPLRGVMHAAMVLDDATLIKLDANKLTRVLRPKLAGADALDRLTRGDDLAYFVLFSSATTFVGNPGQSAYVAANGCLEGLARRRRRQGLPALAVCWGAIEDVGVLATNETLRQSLLDRLSVQPIASDDALEALRGALAQDQCDPEKAVLAIAPIDWPAAKARLGVLRSPTFSMVAQGSMAKNSDHVSKINLQDILAHSGREAALASAGTAIVEVISRVLRLPVGEIDTQRPLVELGIDSLMAVELAMMIESKLKQQIQLTASVGAISVSRLASQLVDQSSLSGNATEAHVGVAMLARHFDTIVDADLSKIKRALAQSDAAAREGNATFSGSAR